MKTSMIVCASLLAWFGRLEAANAGVPAWCNGATFEVDGEDIAQLAELTDPERVMEGLAQASCSTSDGAQAHKAELDRARAAWGKKYGMADADWGEVIAYVQDTERTFHGDFSTHDIAKLTPVDQYRLIRHGWRDDGMDADPLYYADALDSSLSETGRLAFVRWCAEAALGNRPELDVTKWAVCQADLDKLDISRVFAELHGDKQDPSTSFVLRLNAVALQDRLKEIKAAKAQLIKKDAEYGKIFDAAAKGRAEWTSAIGTNTKLLDLVLQMDGAIGFHSRKLLDGCEAKTADALAAAVSTIPANAFTGIHDVHGDADGFAKRALDVLAKYPAVGLAAIAYNHCQPETAMGVMMGAVLENTPSPRGPRNWALTAIMHTELKFDDTTVTQVEYPDIRNHPFTGTRAQIGSAGGVVRSVKMDGDHAIVSVEKTTQKQDECAKEHRGRANRIRGDGSVEYEIICDKWTTVTLDTTAADFKVSTASARWLKPGVVFSAIASRDRTDVLATWPSKTAKLPNMVLGGAVK